MKKENRLAAVEAKRGYLLPYHRMFAADDPELLAAYDKLYEKLTLDRRVLSPRERELVWAGLLTTAREAHGRIHMQRGIDAGLTSDQLGDAIALGAAAETFPALTFATQHWSEWIAPEATTVRYLKLTEVAWGSIEPALAEIILVTCQAARLETEAQRLHLVRAFEAGATRGQIAEALSYILLPCGGPTLIEAVDCWDRMAQEGLCPSPYDS